MGLFDKKNCDICGEKKLDFQETANWTMEICVRTVPASFLLGLKKDATAPQKISKDSWNTEKKTKMLFAVSVSLVNFLQTDIMCLSTITKDCSPQHLI